jgi:hypothetical protein
MLSIETIRTIGRRGERRWRDESVSEAGGAGVVREGTEEWQQKSSIVLDTRADPQIMTCVTWSLRACCSSRALCLCTYRLCAR